MGYICGYSASPVVSTEYQSSGRAFGPGDIYTDYAGNRFRYAQANGAVTGAGYVVVFDVAWTAAALLSTSNDARGLQCGIAMAAMADDDWGWFQIGGVGVVRCLASAAANVRLNTTATGGALDDDGTSGAFPVQGIYLTTAVGGSAANGPCVINDPYMDAVI